MQNGKEIQTDMYIEYGGEVQNDEENLTEMCGEHEGKHPCIKGLHF